MNYRYNGMGQSPPMSAISTTTKQQNTTDIFTSSL